MSTANDTEARLARIEETLYFQDEKLKDLERHILAQQAALDSLERQNAAFKGALERLRDQKDANFSAFGQDPSGLAEFGCNSDKQAR